MSLPLLAIRRHVVTTALSLVLLLMGAVAYQQLSLDRMPKLNIPVLTVATSLPGADPDTVAKSLTAPIEAQLNTVSGLDTLSSVSGQGTSNVTLTFTSDTDMSVALADVQSKLERVRRALPEEAGSPAVFKMDLNAEPVIQLMLTTENASRTAVTTVAKSVKKRLEGLAGVGEVQLSGTQEEMLLVSLDKSAMAANRVTVSDVQGAILNNHLQPAAGKARFSERDYSLKLDFEAGTPEELGAMLLSVREGAPLRLRDVAVITRAPDTAKQVARFNGQAGVAIRITKAEDANPVTVVDSVQARIAEMQASLPAGMRITVASEEAKPIRDLVDALGAHLVEGTLLTGFIIWLFLKNVRATLIVAVAIPVSLLGALAAFQLFDYTLNSFTLLALLLLIGVVVDDTIVVLDNIYRVQEKEGLRGEAAAAKGADGVLFSVSAATLALVAIFGPVMYLGGVMGQVFLPFAAVVTVGVLVSWFVAVTLTPMLCAKFLTYERSNNVIGQWLESSFQRLEKGYTASLSLALRHRKKVLFGAFLTLVPAGFFLMALEKGFMPTQSTGRLTVRVELAAGMPVALIDQKLKTVERVIQASPEVESTLATYQESGRSGTAAASVTITLKALDAHKQAAVIAKLNKQLLQVDGVRATTSASQGGGGDPGLRFNLVGPDMPTVAKASEQLSATLRQNPVTASLRNNLNLSSPQLTLSLNQEAASQRGVTGAEVSRGIAAATGELIAGYYTGLDGERYPIKISAEGGALNNSDALLSLKVRGYNQQLYPLREVVNVKLEGAASTITRESQQYAVSFFGVTNGAMGTAIDIIESATEGLPDGIYTTFSGQAKEFSKLGKSLGLVLLSALLLLYLVMASQFNNYRQPWILMLAQPLAAFGGLGALWVAGQTLNIYSMVGLVLLIGLTAKTGVLLVDRANQRRGEGMSSTAAMMAAAPERLRPILMTALTVIASLLPASLGFGAGAENNGPLAVAVIGGMLSATLLTLYVVPLAYAGKQPSGI